VELDLSGSPISDENWTTPCHSVKGHPTLAILDLTGTSSTRDLNGDGIEMSTEQKAQRTRMLSALVQENRVLHKIRLNRNERDEQIYVESIAPHLETNLYGPRVLGIKKVDIALRRAFLGLALQTESDPFHSM
jgi:hypothetical protein